MALFSTARNTAQFGAVAFWLLLAGSCIAQGAAAMNQETWVYIRDKFVVPVSLSLTVATPLSLAAKNIGEKTGFTPWDALWLACLLWISIIAAIILAYHVTRKPVERESRVREQPGIRGDVQARYRSLATRAREVSDATSAGVLSAELLASMEIHFSNVTVSEFRDRLKEIDRRTDFKEILRLVAVKLEAMMDSLHYSDIKRLPKP